MSTDVDYIDSVPFATLGVSHSKMSTGVDWLHDLNSHAYGVSHSKMSTVVNRNSY